MLRPQPGDLGFRLLGALLLGLGAPTFLFPAAAFSAKGFSPLATEEWNRRGDRVRRGRLNANLLPAAVALTAGAAGPAARAA
jgi:hypothetical protein